jgi:S1-C subfamily serine protease
MVKPPTLEVLMRRVLLPTILLAAAAAAVPAQGTPAPSARSYAFSTFNDDGDRAMLGVSTQSDGVRDTLGVLVMSVTAGSPAEKAGIEEGNRIASINGVNLKLSRADAGESDMSGVMTNRLSREMRKLKSGDEAKLEVWANGRYRTVNVKTVAADELLPRHTSLADENDRAALGLSLSSSGSKRDTLGVFVSRVTQDGPAEKAGIVEGDRIASINGVDLRTPKEDLGEGWMSSNRVQRLQREILTLKAGQAAELVVVSGGRSRTVKVATVKASELKDSGGFAYRIGDGNTFMLRPGMMTVPRTPPTPRVRIPRDFDGGFDTYFDGLRQSLDEIGPTIRLELQREMPKAMDEVRSSMERLRQEMPLIRARLTRRVVI